MPDFKGPGQWRSQAVKAQKLEDDTKGKVPAEPEKKPVPKKVEKK